MTTTKTPTTTTATLPLTLLLRAVRKARTATGITADVSLTVHPDRVEVGATDGELIFTTVLDATNTHGTGTGAVKLRYLQPVLDSLKGEEEVTVTIPDPKLTLTAGTAEVVLDQAANLPPPYTHGTGPPVPVPGPILRDAVAVVNPALEVGGSLFGSILFDQEGGYLRLVGSDTYRVAVQDLPGVPWSTTVHVPGKYVGRALRTLGKLKVYSLSVWEERLVIANGETVVSIPVPDNEYPRYRGWAPPFVSKVVLDRLAVAFYMRRVMALKDPNPSYIPYVWVTVGDGTVTLRSKGTVGVANSEFAATVTGLVEPVSLLVNARFLHDAVVGCKGGAVAVELVEDPTTVKPVRVTGSGTDSAWHLVMPARGQ